MNTTHDILDSEKMTSGHTPLNFEMSQSETLLTRPISPGIYLIGEPENYTSSEIEKFLTILQELLIEGVALFQIRQRDRNLIKDGPYLEVIQKAQKLCQNTDTPFIINDRLDLALITKADGLHLGASDIPYLEARRLLPNKIIGLSNHHGEDVERHRHFDADYFSLGPIHATTSKLTPDPVMGIRQFERLLPLFNGPVVGIGGLTPENLGALCEARVDFAGVISGIWKNPDPLNSLRLYKKIFSEHHRKKSWGVSEIWPRIIH
jgi:thiamine-phosphate pyrophosphorylase